MEFPISLVADFLIEENCILVHAPIDRNKTFKWVISDPAAAGPGYAEDMLYIVDRPEQAPEAACSIIVSGETRGVPAHAFSIRASHPTTAESLARSLQLHLLSIYQWIEDMHHALGSHCDCEELLRLSEPILKNYISITDSTFAHIAHTPNIGPIEEASKYLVEHGRYSDEVINAARSSGLSELWARSRPFKTFESNAINPKPSIEHVYHLNSQYAAHLVMVCEKPITPGQEFLFSLLVPSVATVLNGMWRMESPLAQRYTPFLTSLLHEGIGDRDAAYRQARALGIPTEGIFKILVISDSWKGGSSSYFAQRALLLLDGCWAVADKDDLIILLHADKNDAGRLRKLEEKAFDLIEKLDAQVGTSRKFFDVLDLQQAVEEAKIALRYGKLHHREFPNALDPSSKGADSFAFRFKRYFPFFACDPHARETGKPLGVKTAESVIGTIERADEANGTNDAILLQTYFRTSCTVKETARILNMHRNSVSYRLRHIEQTYDLNLDDPDEIVFLCTLFLIPR